MNQIAIEDENKKRKLTTICIPRVDLNTSKQYIFHVFKKLNIGFVENISEYPIKNNSTHKRIMIKIKWNKTELAKYICDRFDIGENIKIVHSNPWYWSICEAR